ncbi:MAG: FG-GAP repeat domain-containing protein [Planctomycetota bacterium]
MRQSRADIAAVLATVAAALALYARGVATDVVAPQPAAQPASPAASFGPVPASETLPGQIVEEVQSLWQAFTAALPPSEGRMFGVRALWLDEGHSSVLCVYRRYHTPSLDPQDHPNACAAVLEKSGEGYKCRQLFDLWSPSSPQVPPESPDFKRRNRTYGRVDFYRADLDRDGDADIVVNLILVGGSYAGAETIALLDDGGRYHVVLSKTGAESQRWGYEVDVDRIDRIADLDGDGIPEIRIWREFMGPEPHSNARCWLDIYHWDGATMVECNALFPASFDLPRRGFKEVCRRHPDETGLFYYFLGRIAEYQYRPKSAGEYYVRCRDDAGAPREFRDAAQNALKALTAERYRYPSVVLEGLKEGWAVRMEAPTLAALLDKAKPDIVFNTVDMMWADTGDDDRMRFTLDRAFRFHVEGQPTKWVLVASGVRGDLQLSGQYTRRVIEVAEAIPREDHWPSYAIVKSASDEFGTLYEIGWQGVGGIGGSGNHEGRSVLYVLRDDAGRWRFIGEGPGECNGRSGGEYTFLYSVESTVVWTGDPESPVEVRFVCRDAKYQGGLSDYEIPADIVRRDYVSYTEAVLEGPYPASLRRTTEHPYMVVEEDETFDSLVEHLARWELLWITNRGNARQRLLAAWRRELRRLNPSLTEGAIPAGTRAKIGRVELDATPE